MGDTYKGLNQWSQAIEQYAVRCSFTLAQFHTFCMYHSALRVRPSYHEALNDLVSSGLSLSIKSSKRLRESWRRGRCHYS
jgi:hypothetical protein